MHLLLDVSVAGGVLIRLVEGVAPLPTAVRNHLGLLQLAGVLGCGCLGLAL